MSEITLYGEKYRKKEDQLISGLDFQKDGGVHYNLAGMFLLFRGALMMPEWFQDYINEVEDGKKKGCINMVCLAGNSSCSLELEVATQFAFKGAEEEWNTKKTPVLFIIGCQKYKTFTGFRMTSAYTAFPQESEILLREGCPVYVLGVDKDVPI